MDKKQLAYKIDDEMFKSFMDNNKIMIGLLNSDHVYPIIKKIKKNREKDFFIQFPDGSMEQLYGVGVCLYPWYVVAVAKVGDYLVFFDKNFNKLYSYYLCQ